MHGCGNHVGCLSASAQRVGQGIVADGYPEQAVSIFVKQKGKSYTVGTVFDFDYTGSVQQVIFP